MVKELSMVEHVVTRIMKLMHKKQEWGNISCYDFFRNCLMLLFIRLKDNLRLAKLSYFILTFTQYISKARIETL